jgi:hypothetical protein
LVLFISGDSVDVQDEHGVVEPVDAEYVSLVDQHSEASPLALS